MVAAQLLLFFIASLGLLSYVGYGLARLLLQGSLQRWRVLLMPLVGLCVIVVGSSFLNYLLPMRYITWLLIAGSTVLNLALIARTRSLGLSRPPRDEGVVVALTALTYLLGVLPLIHAGTTAFLGVQWDLELYLPLTEYLKRFPMGEPLSTFPNPLLSAVNSVPVRGGSGWGFSYLEAFLGTVLFLDSYESFRPALHLMFALSVPAVFCFCRGGLHMSSGSALLAAGLSAVNGLNLWIVSIGLAGHTVAFPMLPLALTTTLWAVQERRLTTIVLAGTVVSTLLLSFYTGAVVIYGLAAGAWGLMYLARTPHRAKSAQAALRVALVVFVLAGIGHLRFRELLPLYGQYGFSDGWLVTEFSPLSQALGLMPYALITERVGSATLWEGLPAETLASLATGLSWATIVLCLLALRRRTWDRAAFLSFALVFIAFGLYLRFAQVYAYGHFKLLSLSTFLLLGGLAQGVSTLWHQQAQPLAPGAGPGAAAGSDLSHMEQSTRATAPATLAAKAVSLRKTFSGRTSSLLLRGGILVYILLFLPLLAHNTLLGLRYYWEPDPAELSRSVWELRALKDLIPPGAPVSLTSRSGFNPSVAAVAAYFLLDNPIAGDARTAYGQLKSDRPDQHYDYILLQADERADVRGLQPSNLLWRNEVAALYKRPQHWLTDIDLESARNPLTLGPRQKATLVLSEAGWSLISGDTQFQGELPGAAGLMQVEFTILAFQETSALLKSPAQETQIELPSGLVTYRTSAVGAPTILELSLPGATKPAWLLKVRIQQPAEPGPSLVALPDLFALRPTPQVGPNRAELSLDYHLSDTRGGFLALAIELYQQEARGAALNPKGFWRLEQLKELVNGSTQFFLDLAMWRCGAVSAALSTASGTPLEDGKYQAHLAVYYVNEEVARWTWLDFIVRQGRAVEPSTRPLPAYPVLYLSTPKDVRALGEALPEGATVYVPTLVDPDRSFVPVAVALLREHRFYTDTPALLPGALPASPSVAYEYGLLPPTEDPAVWGFASNQLWANDQAALYRRDPHGTRAQSRLGTGYAPNAPAPANALLLDATASMNGDAAAVTVNISGSRPSGSIVGIDIYGESACSLQHYGYWGTPLPGAPATFQIDLSLPAQEGRLLTLNGSALPTDARTWPVHQGTFRAFLFYKEGERYETSPLFEFTLANGWATRFRAYPQRMHIPLTGDGHTSIAR